MSEEIKDEPKKSKEIIFAEDKRVKELETRVAELQKLRQEDKTLIDQLSELVKTSKQVPSARIPGKTLLDELEEFMAFGKENKNE